MKRSICTVCSACSKPLCVVVETLDTDSGAAELLEVDKSANPIEIKKAYRKVRGACQSLTDENGH
jgi:hypothetical protein